MDSRNESLDKGVLLAKRQMHSSKCLQTSFDERLVQTGEGQVQYSSGGRLAGLNLEMPDERDTKHKQTDRERNDGHEGWKVSRGRGTRLSSLVARSGEREGTKTPRAKRVNEAKQTWRVCCLEKG